MSDPRPLPAAWDGVSVEWGAWEAGDDIHICPPQKPQPCHECGLIRPRAFAVGRYRVQVGRRFRLHAYRCTECGHDTVYDYRTGTTWDLDMLDYGPDGSWPSQ